MSDHSQEEGHTWASTCPECCGTAVFRHRGSESTVGACTEQNECFWAGEGSIADAPVMVADSRGIEEVVVGAHMVRVESTGINDFSWSVSPAMNAFGVHRWGRSATREAAWQVVAVALGEIGEVGRD